MYEWLNINNKKKLNQDQYMINVVWMFWKPSKPTWTPYYTI